jgi:hypothetical protein
MPEEVERVFFIRSMLVLLNDMGLSGEICRQYKVSADDLELLAFIEAGLIALRPDPQPQGGRHGDSTDSDTG